MTPFEKCPISNIKCAYCSKDESKELRCGIGVTVGRKTKERINHIKKMKECPKGD